MTHSYQAPWWLGRGLFGKHVGAHVQTVYPALFGARPTISYTRERWDSTPNGTPDGDFIDVDRIWMAVLFRGPASQES